jgi:hypothetical protein
VSHPQALDREFGETSIIIAAPDYALLEQAAHSLERPRSLEITHKISRYINSFKSADELAATRALL